MDRTPIRRSHRLRITRTRDDEEAVTPITTRSRRLVDATENLEQVNEMENHSPPPQRSSINEGTPSSLPSLPTSGVWPRTTPEPVDYAPFRIVDYDQSAFQDVLNRLIASDGPCSLRPLTQVPQDLPELQESRPFGTTLPLPSPPETFPLSCNLHPMSAAPDFPSPSPDLITTKGKLSTACALLGLRNDDIGFRQSFFESGLHLEHQPLLSDILQAVLSRPLSQVTIALAKWPTNAHTLVATSLLPVDVIQNRYNYYMGQFTYHGSLKEILDGQADSPRVRPARDSEE